MARIGASKAYPYHAEAISCLDNRRLPKEEAAMFRVVQEALKNVIRHAVATCVHVAIKSQADVFSIAVEDDKRGMTEEQINDSKPLGIVGLRERIARLGGKFNILSAPGKGTRLEIEIPQQ